jgi:nitrate reductase delta subunit
MITFKALGALLLYPDAQLIAALPAIEQALASERLLSDAALQAVRAMTRALSQSDLIDAQERYVELFDRGRATSLHLFEHVHSESRDRGQAMVDLQAIYQRAGFTMVRNELPDYLPAVLEYLSKRPIEEAREMLGDCSHILHALCTRLEQRDSMYAAVLAALLDVLGKPALPTQQAEPEPALDELWSEQPVMFGPTGPSCGARAPQVSVVRFSAPQMRRQRT